MGKKETVRRRNNVNKDTEMRKPKKCLKNGS